MRKDTTPTIIALLFFILSFFSLLTASAQSTPDPGIRGSLPVTKVYYNLGDKAFKPASFPDTVEVRGSVHYPTGLPGGPYPVLVFLHGRHSTCYQTSNPSNTQLAWPCPTGYQSIVSFEGYDSLANLMASFGYIVISVSCNGINAQDNSLADRGMPARGQLMQHHLDLWNTWNTGSSGPFGSLFVGKLDMTNIGTMGHSRGGEGVVFHAEYNRSLGSPYGIRAVITLAPVDFSRHILNGIPLLNIAPYCDGDVSSISGVHFYDDARYMDPTDESAKHNLLLMGANHNYFNTVWTPGFYVAGTSDDWGTTDIHCGTAGAQTHRLSSQKQRAALNAYAAAFFRRYIGNDTTFSPILEVEDRIPPITSRVDTADVYMSYHPGASKRGDLNRTDSTTRATTNNLGGAVGTLSLVSSGICGAGFAMTACNVSPNAAQEPHKGTASTRGLGEMRMRWDALTDYYQNSIPASAQNISGYKSLMFRAAVNFAETTAGTRLDMTIQLIDSAGNTASVVAGNYTKAFFYQPGTRATLLPHCMFNTVRIPLSDFSGVDQTKIRTVRFLFNRMTTGSLLVSDITFTGLRGPASAVNHCSNIDAHYRYDSTGIYTYLFSDSSTAIAGDTTSWLWNFGDTASHAANTSTLKYPTHVFSGPGTYTVCLRVISSARDTVWCRDSICTSIVVPVYIEPCGAVDANFSSDSIGIHRMAFYDSTRTFYGDSLSYSWHFGDAASGTNDSSLLKNPVHRFTAAGSYHVCLYAYEHRPRGRVCADTFCADVIVNEYIEPCDSVNANYRSDSVGERDYKFYDNSVIYSGDSLYRTWNFGDPASGAANLSHLANPEHVFSSPATYTVCLYLEDHRPRGGICRDTLCRDLIITVNNTGIQEWSNAKDIRIYPNPAGDYVIIEGAMPDDALRLTDVYGRIVWETRLSGQRLSLPQSLASGAYYMSISGREYQVVRKLQVIR